MSKVVKIGISLIVATFIIVGGLIYFVSQKINPDEIKKLIVKGVEDALPNTSVYLEKVDYSLGTSITVALSGFDLRLKETKEADNKLFNVSEVDVKVPIWAILTGGGAIDVNIKKPKAYYLALNNETFNWGKALPKSEENTEQKPVKEAKESKKSVSIPSFINNSKINIKVSDLELDYRPYQAKVSKINVNKILLKNINLKTTTAFEIASHINYVMDVEKTLKTDIRVIGEVNIGKFLKDKSLQTTVLTNLLDTSITGMNFKIPDLENKLKLTIEPNGKIITQSEFKAGNILEANIDAILVDKKLTISRLSANTNLANISDVLPKELADSLGMVDLSKSKLTLDGDVLVNLEPLQLRPNLSFEIKNPINLKLKDSLSIANTFKGSFKGKDVSLKLISELFSGSITSEVKTQIDPLSLPSKLSQYPLTKVDIIATNIKLTRDFLQNTLYGGKKEKEDVVAAGSETQVVEKGEPVDLPPVNLTLEGKNIFIDKEELEINSDIKVRGNTVSSQKMQILYGTGVTSISFNTVLRDTKNILNDFKVSLKKMNLAALNSLLPPFISKISGIYEGNVNGNLNLLSKGLDYNIRANFAAYNGDLENLDVKKLVGTFFEGMKDKVPKKYENVSNRFDKLAVNVKATPAWVDVDNFVMIGDKKSAKVDLRGRVSMMDKKSALKGEIMLESTRAQLEKEFGISQWPVRFSGDGFILKPDLGYTTGRLADIKVKAAGKKATKEIAKKVEVEKKKVQKKLEKDLKKKANKLLKGFKL